MAGCLCIFRNTIYPTRLVRFIRHLLLKLPLLPSMVSANGRQRRQDSVGVQEISILKELQFPHSVGLLYSAFTYYTGFVVNSGEYKLMGLAPYGNPSSARTLDFSEKITTELVDIREDGSIVLNMDWFDYATGLTMVNEGKWQQLFGIPRRKAETEISQVYMDMALAIQLVTEEIVLRLA